MLDAIVVLIGAGVIFCAHAVTGYRVHCWFLDHAPGLAAWIPRDGGAIFGISVGIAQVWWWFLA